VEVLKLACRAAGLNKDALQEALKDAAVRAQMEVLKKRETELEAEVMDK
jgi:cell division protein FtsB